MQEPGRILLIEDNADDELLTLRAFQKSKLNNKIDVVRDGEQAIQYFSKARSNY
jgi:CheY-like chemotaxis protein